MWFKNLIFYRFIQPFTLSEDALQEKLNDKRFQLCGPLDQSTFGWSAPLGAKHEQQLTFTAGNCIMLCARREEKVLPASVIKEFVNDKVVEIEDQQMRKVGRKEKDDIRDEILHDLLPRAFTRSVYTYAYIDTKTGFLVVDASSHKRAEDLTSLLRKCLGSLPIEPPTVTQSPTSVMTSWLKNDDIPSDLVIEDECELKSPDDSGAVIRCKSQDMGSEEIQGHLTANKQVTKLSVTWDERLSFNINDDLTLKRVRLTDVVQDKISECNAESMEEQFDVDFTVMCLEFSHLLPRVLAFFGGEQMAQQAAVA